MGKFVDCIECFHFTVGAFVLLIFLLIFLFGMVEVILVCSAATEKYGANPDNWRPWLDMLNVLQVQKCSFRFCLLSLLN